MKLRRTSTSLICTVMTFMMAFPIYAEENTAAPCGLVTQCPKCFGVVDIHNTKKYIGEEHPLCIHIWEQGAFPGVGDGRYHYEIYEVTHEENCRNCSYSNTTTREERVLISCDYAHYIN